MAYESVTSGGVAVTVDTVDASNVQVVKLDIGADGVVSGPVGASNALPVTRTLPSSLGDGRKTVTTPGTAVALAASTACRRVVVTALPDNTELVVAGGSGVVAAVATRTGRPLAPGACTVFEIDNVSKVFVDAVTAGEGVCFSYEA